MHFRYHGNWCGPGWSDGRYVSSTHGFAPAIDEFDETCRQHDFALAGGASDPEADAKFFEDNVNKGAKRSVAAYAVAARSAFDNMVQPPTTKIKNKIEMASKTTKKGQTSKSLRGSQGGASTGAPMRKNDAVRAAPVALATRRTGTAARVTTTATGVTVSHRSFLLPVNNSLNYTVQALACNPGMAGSFPWLAKLARRYEQYRFKKLKYEFRSVAASSTSGVVMMSFDYDPADAAPTTKSEQAQTVPNAETNVWMNNNLSVPVDSVWRFVRAGTLGANLDIKTYDMGNLWLSSSYGNNVTGGELYVEYTVEFRRPTDGPEVCGTFTTSTTQINQPVSSLGNATTGAAFPLTRKDDNTFTVVAGGEYLLGVRAVGTVMTAATPTPTLISGGTTAAVASLFSVVSATSTFSQFKIRVDTGDEINFANAGAASTITSTRFYISPIDYTAF